MNQEILTESLGETTIEQEPWHILFTVGGKSAKVKLKNKEDLLKIAELFSGLLSASGIENDLEIS